MDIELPKHTERLFLTEEESDIFKALMIGGAPLPNKEFDKGALLGLSERGYIELDKLTFTLTEAGMSEVSNDAVPYLPKTELFATNRLKRILVEVAAQTRVGNLKMAVAKKVLKASGFGNLDSADIRNELSEMEKTGHIYKSGNNMYYLHVSWLYLFKLRKLNQSNYSRIEEKVEFSGDDEKRKMFAWLGGEYVPGTGWVFGGKTKYGTAKPSTDTLDSLADDDHEYASLGECGENFALPEGQSTACELDPDAMLEESIGYVDEIVEKTKHTPYKVENKEQKIKFLQHLSGGLFLDNQTCQALLGSIVKDLSQA